jgi:hypothetical protein
MKVPADATRARFDITFSLPVSGVTFAPHTAFKDIEGRKEKR